MVAASKTGAVCRARVWSYGATVRTVGGLRHHVQAGREQLERGREDRELAPLRLARLPHNAHDVAALDGVSELHERDDRLHGKKKGARLGWSRAEARAATSHQGVLRGVLTWSFSMPANSVNFCALAKICTFCPSPKRS